MTQFSDPREMAASRHQVFLAGFQSNTLALQQCGWKLRMQTEPYNRRLTLALRHDGFNIEMMSSAADYPRMPYEPFEFNVHVISPDIHIQSSVRAVPFMSVDRFFMDHREEIQYVTSKLFPDKVTETILVEPSSVTECLDLIRRLQAPVLSDIRKRSIQEGQNMQYHAQILSIA